VDDQGIFSNSDQAARDGEAGDHQTHTKTPNLKFREYYTLFHIGDFLWAIKR